MSKAPEHREPGEERPWVGAERDTDAVPRPRDNARDKRAETGRGEDQSERDWRPAPAGTGTDRSRRDHPYRDDDGERGDSERRLTQGELLDLPADDGDPRRLGDDHEDLGDELDRRAEPARGATCGRGRHHMPAPAIALARRGSVAWPDSSNARSVAVRQG